MFILIGFHHESTVLYRSFSQSIRLWSPSCSAGLLSVYSITKPTVLCMVILCLIHHGGLSSVYSIMKVIDLCRAIVCPFHHKDHRALQGYSLTIPSWSPPGSAGFFLSIPSRNQLGSAVVVSVYSIMMPRALQGYSLWIQTPWRQLGSAGYCLSIRSWNPPSAAGLLSVYCTTKPIGFCRITVCLFQRLVFSIFIFLGALTHLQLVCFSIYSPCQIKIGIINLIFVILLCNISFKPAAVNPGTLSNFKMNPVGVNPGFPKFIPPVSIRDSQNLSRRCQPGILPIRTRRCQPGNQFLNSSFSRRCQPGNQSF